MPIRIKNNHRTNRLIQLLIIAGDFVVLWGLLYYLVDTIPQSEGWDDEKGVLDGMHLCLRCCRVFIPFCHS